MLKKQKKATDKEDADYKPPGSRSKPKEEKKEKQEVKVEPSQPLQSPESLDSISLFANDQKEETPLAEKVVDPPSNCKFSNISAKSKRTDSKDVESTDSPFSE